MHLRRGCAQGITNRMRSPVRERTLLASVNGTSVYGSTATPPLIQYWITDVDDALSTFMA
jgi:hypothetical protein